jgi:4-amino-4-deoxy-L-arabinose transferase-like glycosyltransferase
LSFWPTVANTIFLMIDCPFDLAGDEAHYWEWSRRLDWSYYSKGPLVAHIIAAGRWLLGEWSIRQVGSEMLAVRLPAVGLSVVTLVGIATLAWRITRCSSIVAAALGLVMTMPIFAVGAKLMTIDAPLMALWVWALILVHAGLRGRSIWPWLATGVLIGLGILAKYNMLLLFPAVLLTVMVSKELHVHLRRPGPYLATVIGLLGFVPILVWNAQHEWVSFRHVAGQAGVSGGPSINLAGPFEYLLNQLIVVNAIWFIGLCLAVLALWRQPTHKQDQQSSWEMVLLLAAAVTPYLVFLGFSPLTKIQPNWPVTGLAAGVIVLAIWIRRQWLAPIAGIQRRMRIYLWSGQSWGCWRSC